MPAAERLFARWGVLAVFFGRFVALLRIFAGPLAGALRMHYPRFLAANVLGGHLLGGGHDLRGLPARDRSRNGGCSGSRGSGWSSRWSPGSTIGAVIKRRTARLVEDDG